MEENWFNFLIFYLLVCDDTQKEDKIAQGEHKREEVLLLRNEHKEDTFLAQVDCKMFPCFDLVHNNKF